MQWALTTNWGQSQLFLKHFAKDTVIDTTFQVFILVLEAEQLYMFAYKFSQSLLTSVLDLSLTIFDIFLSFLYLML